LFVAKVLLEVEAMIVVSADKAFNRPLLETK
jgi:hypothetical protein